MVRLKADTTATLWFVLFATAVGFAQGGPYERQRIDNAAADRGRAVYARHCINCHGSTAKGTERGPDLIRSTVVLRDRLGNGIGPSLPTRPVRISTGLVERRFLRAGAASLTIRLSP